MKVVIIGSIMSTDTEVSKAALLESMEVFATITFPDDEYDENFIYQIYEDEVEKARKSRNWDERKMSDGYSIFTSFINDEKKYVKVVAVDKDDEFNGKELPKAFDSLLMGKAEGIIKKVLKMCKRSIESRQIYVEIDEIKGNEKLFSYLDMAVYDYDYDLKLDVSEPFIKDGKICLCVFNYEAKRNDEIRTMTIK